MPIEVTRTLVAAALGGALDGVEYRIDPVFGFEVPVECEGVDATLLDPRSTWSDPARYDEQAAALAASFRENFAAFAAEAGEDVAAAGPRG
jgi:phosphoenolpyruvate carboxykinase (ATP)